MARPTIKPRAVLQLVPKSSPRDVVRALNYAAGLAESGELTGVIIIMDQRGLDCNRVSMTGSFDNSQIALGALALAQNGVMNGYADED